MTTGAKILVVDDEKSIRRFLEVGLETQGYKVLLARNGKEGVKQAADHHPDLVVLDLGLPDIHGLEVLKKIRESSATPVIVLTVQSSDKDKETLLDSGADDYVTKPFSMTELSARIRVCLRHSINLKDTPVFEGGPLRIDFAKRSVTVNDNLVKLTPTEFDLLKALARHPGRIVTQQQLLKEIWGPASLEQSHYLRIYIGQLRRKIEKDPAVSGLILTEQGVGYRLNLP